VVDYSKFLNLHFQHLANEGLLRNDGKALITSPDDIYILIFLRGNLGRIKPKMSCKCHVVNFSSFKMELINGWFGLQTFETLSRYIANF
jgi:hypothetical protein